MPAANILHLGVKELRSLARDPLMLVLIVYAFTASVYTAATAMPETLNKAAIAIVDEDRSPLSARITDAFYPPYFLQPVLITSSELDARMDACLATFEIVRASCRARVCQYVEITVVTSSCKKNTQTN